MIAKLPRIRRSTPDDLMKLNLETKAELVNGEIVPIMASGGIPGVVAVRILRKLADFVDDFGKGYIHADNIGCVVPVLSSGRESFVPDVGYYDLDPSTLTMKYIQGFPAFAVEVRSDGDYGRTAEREMAAKRADYFEAGTQIVWDVDPIDKVVRVYRTAHPDTPEVFGLGQTVSAEPVLPGWSLSVDRIFA
jgi:Uma2 family endonuclease